MKRLATHTVVGSAVVVAAESTEQEIARLRQEVVELRSSQQCLEREQEELHKAAEGKSSPFCLGSCFCWVGFC